MKEYMSDLLQNVKKLFKQNEHILSIGESSMKIFSTPDKKREFVIYLVTYNLKNDRTGEPNSNIPPKKAFRSGKQEYQTYVHHAIDSLELFRGLPRKLGGELVSMYPNAKTLNLI